MTTPALSASSFPNTSFSPHLGTARAPLMIMVTTFPMSRSNAPCVSRTQGYSPSRSTSCISQSVIWRWCVSGLYAEDPDELFWEFCIWESVQGDHASMGVWAVRTGSTSAGQPSRRWKMSWAQPGRRDVDHIPARRGVMPVNRTRSRLCETRRVGFGSQSGMTDADSVRSLCVSAVSAVSTCQYTTKAFRF